MLQLQVGGRRETSSLQISRLQARQGREAKQRVEKNVQDCSGNGSLPVASAQGDATQQHTATAAALSCTGLPSHSRRNKCPFPWDTTNKCEFQSAQAPDANRSSLNAMFTVVATVLQQIMTELNGAETGKVRIMKTALKLMKKNGR
jgi:hypothetical protein